MVRCALAVGIVISLNAIKPTPAPHINNLEQPAQQIAVKRPVAGESEAHVKKTTKKVKPKAKPKPKPKKVAERPPVEVPKSKEDLLRAAGIPESDWQAVDYIVSKESSWRHDAINASSGATGLCQSLPASKMASAGGDYMTNPVTQLKWCHSYAQSRYGSWWSAHAFWLANAWW